MVGNDSDRNGDGQHSRRHLAFSRYETPAGVSLASLAPGLLDRCGIYVLEFEPGDAYVGQTVTILSRFASHRRTWDDIVAVRFAPCQIDRLDELELAVVQREQKTRDVRNLLLTKRPGGTSDLEIVVRDGRAVALPWTRSARSRLGDVAPSSPEARFWRLSKDGRYPTIRALLATYVRNVVPAPVDSQGLWVLTAFPSTLGRLFTMTVGNTETLYAGSDDADAAGFWVVLNVSDRDGLAECLDSCDIPLEHEQARYAIGKHHPIRRIVCDRAASALALLEHDWLLEVAHSLVVTLMRRGSAPNRGRHNWSFSSDVIRAAWQSGTGRP